MQWPPRPGPGLNGHEAERLRRCGLDDLPDVDVHPVAELRELVDERDVDRPEDVLEELRELGRLGRRDGVHVLDRRRVERRGRSGRALVDASDDLGDGLRRPVLTPRIDPLGREREVEVLAAGEAASALEDRLHLLARRARIRRRLEDDEVTRAQPRRDLLRCRDEDPQVGLALSRERGRQGDENRVGLAQLVVVGRRGDEPALDERLQDLGRDVLDVALAVGSAVRRAPGRRPRGARACRRPRRSVRAGRRRSRLRRWRRRASSGRDRSDEHLRDPLGRVPVAVQHRTVRRHRRGRDRARRAPPGRRRRARSRRRRPCRPTRSTVGR